jgi:hypothetical protein
MPEMKTRQWTVLVIVLALIVLAYFNLRSHPENRPDTKGEFKKEYDSLTIGMDQMRAAAIMQLDPSHFDPSGFMLEKKGVAGNFSFKVIVSNGVVVAKTQHGLE